MNGKSNFLESGIEHPNDHDVLSGRGNFVNYHAGNEHFRALVRKHKIAYVACPKPQKGKFSRMIVDEIRNREPTGRFLKQDNDTKMWYDIGDKKALDKTRQALREGAPEILKEIDPEDEEHEGEVSQGIHSIHQQGFGGASGFGVSDAPNFSSVNQAVISGMQPPSLVQSGVMPLSGVPSSDGGISQLQRAQMQMNRVVPGMLNIPAGTTQLGALRGSGGGGLGALASAIQGAEAQMGGQMSSDPYGVNQFEPTPINPNAQIRVAQLDARDKPAPAPQMRGLQRDNSLTFENLFTKDNLSQVGKSTKRTMEGSSQHLSAMSFSIGDMTDASNLSAVFEDSMRISDDAATAVTTAPLEAKTKSSFSDKRKPNAAPSNANIDMSVASLGGSLGLESSMMHMSFKSGFDEDSTKDIR
mmetsp:Transcript_18947/g.31379  ORF Transcript_18947/g.31379 Transcript_18947/m.31379 type:complete len:414 (-) Transcript_18947:54-1295(-)|eukprot:CAMPEP_0119003864 /NCGR_PEP_ID=MMETSP1176-20130426/807_1 /TAXON_ID=265551 /ORGANISM="Synedropsis recta cf, Strain CCMP1620" /LENGTH=413 /DNA_ID=CAMNT_0006955501 /DNA_START=251 /DNA_END=1492 /DNA_ORIENTATION=-